MMPPALRCVAVLVLILLGEGIGHAARVIDEAELWRAENGRLSLQLYPEIATGLGLDLGDHATGERENDAQLRGEYALAGSLDFIAPTGDFRRAASHHVAVPELVIRVGAKPMRLDGAHLAWGTEDRFDIVLLDRQGQIWLRMTHAHDRLLNEATTLVFESLDLRVGPALASALGTRRLLDQQLGTAHIIMSVVARQSAALRASSCEVPQWPQPPTRMADVRLSDIDTVQALRARNADGPGGSDGEIVVAPAASLLNVGAADVPWYRKFIGPCSAMDNSGVCAPYGNDQHPFLLWSFYRMDQHGTLRQLARSGLKHAYLSVNSGCDCNRSQILGIGCGDVYGVANNDTPFNTTCTDPVNCHQGVRSELAPREGIWGRCGGVFDPDCNGSQTDFVAYGPYERRLVVRESDIEAISNPNARYFLDSWYVVRDDPTIGNNIGAVRVRPEWVVPTSGPGLWVLGNSLGPFSNGSVVQQWLNTEPAPLRKALIEITTPSGRAQVGVRVEPGSLLPFRYNYVIFNMDLTDTVISGSAPNPRVERAIGIRSLRVGKNATSQAGLFEFFDTDSDAANDWLLDFVSNEVSWQAQGAEHQRWGDLYAFSFEARGEPVMGTGSITARADGNILQENFAIWNAGPLRIFRDGLESP